MQVQSLAKAPSDLFQFIPDAELVKEAIAERSAVRVPVLHAGTFSHPTHGTFVITEEHLHGMVESFEQNGGASNPLETDFEHENSSNERPPQSMKSGEVFALSVEHMELNRFSGPVLVALTVFTDQGRALVASGEVNRVSADFSLAHKFEGVGNPVPFLFKFTLTNNPFLQTLPPIKLSAGNSKSTQIQFIGKENMKEDSLTLATKAEMLAKLMKVLGMESDATGEDFLTRAASLIQAVENADNSEPEEEKEEEEETLEADSTEPAKQELSDDSKSETDEVKNLKFSLKASEKEKSALEQRVQALEAKNEKDSKDYYENTRDNLLLTAVSEGKITKEQSEHYRDKTFAYERNNPLEELEFQLGVKAPKFGTKIPNVLIGNDTSKVSSINSSSLVEQAEEAVRKGEFKNHTEAITSIMLKEVK
jgi:phage I-like protein